MIVNPRGTGGSGKTEFVRRIIARYSPEGFASAEPIHRPGRERPIAYRLRHPTGGPPLVVLGHYERTSGGCDTIRVADGGLGEIFRLADAWAAAGHDVLLEGAAWSVEHRRSAALTAKHSLHVLVLATPPEQAVRNLAARRRAPRARIPRITAAVQAQRDAIEAACGHLRGLASIERLTFDTALDSACNLLGLTCGADARDVPGGETADLRHALRGRGLGDDRGARAAPAGASPEPTFVGCRGG